MLRKISVGIAILCLFACASAPWNEPLTNVAAENRLTNALTTGGYRLPGLNPGDMSPRLLVALAFSGGGKRSAAFSYGALRGLRDFLIEIDNKPRPLLDEVSIIASVSGGSFTAAYYGLYREKTFLNFESDFLRRDLESYIWGLYLLPWHWAWLASEDYGTNDAMADLYDRLMFHGASYADLMSRGTPLISINATDINYGSVFVFTQNQFDLICSDLQSYPVARAVAASNGFPVLFSPITLKNHAMRCGGRRPLWLEQAAKRPDQLSRERLRASEVERYLDPERTKYVHLMDGGISDNLAMRGMSDYFMIYRENADLVRSAAASGLRHLLLISVDGEASPDRSWPLRRSVSGLSQIFSAVSGTQIDRYNFETLIVAREQLRELTNAIRNARCKLGPMIGGYRCDDVRSYFLHLSIGDVGDAALRDRLQIIPTGLTIPNSDIDLLISQGETLIRSSDVLSEFRASLTDDQPRSTGREPATNRVSPRQREFTSR
jgi:NTE family protein